MLKIQVLGRGMIPRGYGLAPRLEPFPADLTLIKTILSTRGLKVNMLNPDTSKFVELTSKNVDKMWNAYRGKRPTTTEPTTIPTTTAAAVTTADKTATEKEEEVKVDQEKSPVDSVEENKSGNQNDVKGEKKYQQGNNNYQNNQKNNNGNNHKNNNQNGNNQNNNNSGILKPVSSENK